MVEINFYDYIYDELLEFAVIIAKTNGNWVLCKHKERDTYEVPGGHREKGETIIEAARRELWEETGAIDYNIEPICMYSVKGDVSESEKINIENYGMLYYANIFSLKKELQSEIEKILITDTLVDNWTYPMIQPRLIEEATKRGFL